MGHDKLIQNSWAAGAWRAGDPALVPADSAYELRDLLLGDDGLPYKRGGSAYKSDAVGNPLRSLWDGDTVAGRRTLGVDTGGFTALDADDATLRALGGAGGTIVRVTPIPNDLIAIESLIGSTYLYGGSRKTANYSTGTITTSADSTTITGAGTAFLANADAGMLLHVGSGPAYVVKSVDSDTQLTLSRAFKVTAGQPAAAGQSYTLARVSAFAGNLGTAGARLTPAIVGSIANRHVRAVGNLVLFSGIDDNENFRLDEDFHDVESVVTGLFRLRDNLLVFTQDGLWVISNMELDIVDFDGNIQHRVERVNPELLLWHRTGVAEWENALVVPAHDAVYLLDSYSSPVPISGPIEDLYRSWVRAGYRPGHGEVYDGHYVLPILNGNVPVATWLCRLDEIRGPDGARRFAWTELSSKAWLIGAAHRTTSPPELLAIAPNGGAVAANRIMRLRWFEPAVSTEADGSAVEWRLTTRDFGTGNLVGNFVARLRALYTLVSAAAVATLTAEVADEATGAWAALSGSGAEDTGDTPKTWRVAKRRRYVRFRLTGSGAAESFVLRALEVFVRKSGRY